MTPVSPGLDIGRVFDRKTREGRVAPAYCWNWGRWGLKEYIIKRSFLGWFVWLVVPVQYKRFLYCLGCSSRPSTKYLFPHRNLFYFIFPIVQQAGLPGSRAASPVSSYVSHWFLENGVLMNCNLPVAPKRFLVKKLFVFLRRKLFIRRDFDRR